MAQFDVHRNIDKQAQHIPYVVIVHSALYGSYRRRVVVPRVRRTVLVNSAGPKPSRLNPVFSIEQIDVMLRPLELVSIAVDQLGEKVGDLQEQAAAIADALDEVFTKIMGLIFCHDNYLLLN
ncbi:MAG: CcdB family protein [Polaromonas sp.]|nr:CcdB family protein [Polaromonas sp.]